MLVVEDDEPIRTHLVRVLGSAGYEVVAVGTGGDAIDEYTTSAGRGERFGLVVLDLGLPDMDGIEVCQRITAADPAAKVVMVTARADEIPI